MCCLHRRKGSHSNELCGSLRAATRMRSGWSLGSKRKFGREVLPIIGFGIVQILKSTVDTFTIIPWHTGSWIGRWNIATARRTQGSSWTACPQRLKPQLRKARKGTSGTRALSVLTAATPLRSHSSYAPTGSWASLSFLSQILEGKFYAECRGSRAPLACSTYRRLVSTPTKLADELPLSPSGSKHLRQSHCAPTTGNCTKLASLGVW